MKIGDEVLVKWLPHGCNVGTIFAVESSVMTDGVVVVLHHPKNRYVTCEFDECTLLNRKTMYKIGDYVVLKKFNGESIKKFGTVKEYDFIADMYLVSFWFRHTFSEKTVDEWFKAENLINADPEAR